MKKQASQGKISRPIDWRGTVIAVTFAACRKGECRDRGEVPLPPGQYSMTFGNDTLIS